GGGGGGGGGAGGEGGGGGAGAGGGIAWPCRRARARRWGLARSSAPWRSPPLIDWSVAAILAPARSWQREDHRNAHVQPSRRNAGGKRHRARGPHRSARRAAARAIARRLCQRSPG